jgi:hypothetical protein
LPLILSRSLKVTSIIIDSPKSRCSGTRPAGGITHRSVRLLQPRAIWRSRRFSGRTERSPSAR